MAAVEPLDDSASAPDGGVRAGLPSRWFFEVGWPVFYQRRGGFCSSKPGEVLGNGGEVRRKTPGCFSSVLVKQKF